MNLIAGSILRLEAGHGDTFLIEVGRVTARGDATGRDTCGGTPWVLLGADCGPWPFCKDGTVRRTIQARMSHVSGFVRYSVELWAPPEQAQAFLAA